MNQLVFGSLLCLLKEININEYDGKVEFFLISENLQNKKKKEINLDFKFDSIIDYEVCHFLFI